MEPSDFEQYVRADEWSVLDVQYFGAFVEIIGLQEEMSERMHLELKLLLLDRMKACGMPVWRRERAPESVGIVRLKIETNWVKLRRRRYPVVQAVLSCFVERFVVVPQGRCKLGLLLATVWEVEPQARVALSLEELLQELRLAAVSSIEKLVAEWREGKKSVAGRLERGHRWRG